MRAKSGQTWVTLLGLVVCCACNQGTKPGSLVGSYAVHGVLVENSCGQNALPTSNPLDFVVEIRTDSGVAYWMPNKAMSNTGTLNDSGTFRFAMSDTKVVDSSKTMRQEEPSDFLSAKPDFDLQKQQDRACALTRKQTVSGKLARRIEDGMVYTTGSDKDASVDDDDLSAEHVIEIAPTSGSECNSVLAALGGAFLALPCEARYLLSGSLDTSGATQADSSGQADSGR